MTVFKNKDLSAILTAAFLLLFSFSFSVIGAGVLFNRSWYNYTTLMLIAYIVFFITVICLFNKFVIEKSGKKLSAAYPYILAAFCVFLFFMQLVFAGSLRFEPIYDMEAVYKGAALWANGGNFTAYRSDTCYADYFYIFPNNLGELTFLTVIFKICNLFKITDYFFAASAVNSAMLCAALAVTSLVCKKLFGVKKAVLALFMFLIFPPFYFCGAVFYTDFLTVLFPVLAFYLFLIGKDKENPKKKVLFFCLSALAAALGILMKFTVIIVLIAIAVALLLTKQWKNVLVFSVCSLVIVGAANVCFNAFIYSKYLDKEKAAELNTPYSHWIMMGLANDGDYESEDFWNTRSYTSQQERKAAIKTETKARLKKLGVSGLCSLALEKSVRCFGDGTCNLTDFLDDNPKNPNGFLYKYLVASGAHHYTYRHICAGIYLSFFVFMLFAAFGELLGRKKERKILIPLLCIFGIMLFLLIWEVNSRYTVNFLPMMFICACAGIDYFVLAVKRAWQRII